MRTSNPNKIMFTAVRIICINYYNYCHNNGVKGFSNLWDNVYVCVCIMHFIITVAMVRLSASCEISGSSRFLHHVVRYKFTSV